MANLQTTNVDEVQTTNGTTTTGNIFLGQSSGSDLPFRSISDGTIGINFPSSLSTELRASSVQRLYTSNTPQIRFKNSQSVDVAYEKFVETFGVVNEYTIFPAVDVGGGTFESPVIITVKSTGLGTDTDPGTINTTITYPITLSTITSAVVTYDNGTTTNENDDYYVRIRAIGLGSSTIQVVRGPNAVSADLSTSRVILTVFGSIQFTNTASEG